MRTSAPPELQPLERQTLNEQAYARLRNAIVSGRIEPGTTLTLRQLSEQMGTSLMPVREAITRLSAENALVVLPQRGIRLPALSADEAEEVWSLRQQLEGGACALAARRVTPLELIEIRRHCEALRGAGESGDLHAVLERNNEFQFSIYRAARSPLLLQMIELLRLKSVPHCTAALRIMLRERADYYDEAWVNHEALVEALEGHNPTRARRVKQADLRAFRAFVQSVGEVSNIAPVRSQGDGPHGNRRGRRPA